MQYYANDDTNTLNLEQVICVQIIIRKRRLKVGVELVATFTVFELTDAQSVAIIT